MGIRIPTPGDVVSAVGGFMQRTEDFVSSALTGAVDAVEHHADQPAQNATIMNPQTGGSAAVQGVVSIDEFKKFQEKVVAAFHAVKDDIASLRAYGPDGQSGLLYQQDEGGGQGGGMDSSLLMVLLLSGSTTSSSSTLTSNPLLLWLLMSGGGRSGGFDLATALALGLF